MLSHPTDDEAGERVPEAGGPQQDGPVPAALPDARRRGARRTALTARTVLLSPCTYLVLAAFAVYWRFAYGQYMQQRAGACDLGIFYQAAAGWAFHLYPYVPIKGYPQFGDHFSPIFILLAPALWIHDSPATMVFAQTALLCLSGVPVYVAVRRVWGAAAASLLLVAYLFSIGVQGSVGFPVHEVMFSAPLIAWGLERALAGRWTQACLLLGATAFVKEDMGLLIAAFAVWLALNRKWRHAAVMLVWGVGMFLLTVRVIIPHYNPNGFTYADDYARTLHAHSIGGELYAMVAHPRNTLRLLFGSPPKRALWSHVLAPVAFLCLGSPITLLALPSLFTSALSGRATQWAWNLYYEMPLMPIVFLGAMDGLNRLIEAVRRVRRWNGVTGAVWLEGRYVPPLAGILLGMFAITVTVHLTPSELLGVWLRTPGTYRAAPGEIRDSTRLLKLVPSGVEVRATNNLAVPLAARDTVTLVGSHVDKGDWAAVDTADPGCPVTRTFIPGYLDSLQSQGFHTVARAGSILILHRVAGA